MIGGERGNGSSNNSSSDRHEWCRISSGESKDSESWHKGTTTCVVTAEMGEGQTQTQLAWQGLVGFDLFIMLLSITPFAVGLVWFGLVWSGLVWSGLVWSGLRQGGGRGRGGMQYTIGRPWAVRSLTEILMCTVSGGCICKRSLEPGQEPRRATCLPH